MAGETNKAFVLLIINDVLLEDNENVDFIINSKYLPNKIGIGNPFKTRLTILNDDSE